MLHRLALPLLCALALLACTKEQQSTYPERRSGRGEPCVALNDCKEPLLCLSGLCLDAKPPVMTTNKQCVVGSCLTDDDCCPAPDPSTVRVCDQLSRDCAGGSRFSCMQHQTTCVCERVCEDYTCSGGAGDCTSDDECGFGNVCYEGKCMECAFDVNCGEGRICERGSCQQACAHDGHCGQLETCDPNGHCAPRGCINDRECISLMRRRDAECRDSECVVPCRNDAACVTFPALLSTCDDGVCRDLGCEQNADCEARFSGNISARSIAICLPADEAEQVVRSSRPSLREPFE